MQYAFGAMSTAAIVPLIDSVGVGWAFTLCEYAAYISEMTTGLSLIRRSHVSGYSRRTFHFTHSTVQPRFVAVKSDKVVGSAECMHFSKLLHASQER